MAANDLTIKTQQAIGILSAGACSEFLRANNGLTDADISAMALAFSKATKLRKIDLSGNKITDASVPVLIEALKGLRLNVLDLQRNKISALEGMRLCGAINCKEVWT